MQTLIAKQATSLVALPMQSAEISALPLTDPFYALPRDTQIGCVYLGFHEGENYDPDEVDGDDYYIIHLSKPIGGIQRLIWFAYARHWTEQREDVKEDITSTDALVDLPEAAKISLGLDSGKYQSSDPEIIKVAGPTIKIPGLSRPVHLREPVTFINEEGRIPRPTPFNWSEVTKGGNRIPAESAITKRVMKSAELMTTFRDAFAQPIIVTSWYRDPVTNRRVRGASNSRHLYGDAVDWYPKDDGITEEGWLLLCELYQVAGVASGLRFFHTDMRPGPPKTWQYKGARKFTHVRHFT